MSIENRKAILIRIVTTLFLVWFMLFPLACRQREANGEDTPKTRREEAVSNENQGKTEKSDRASSRRPGWRRRWGPGGEGPRAVTPVEVTRVTRRPLDVRISTTSTLFSDQNVVVLPEISGQIVRIHHDVGDWVRKGDVLIELDDRDLKVQFEKARVKKERLEIELKRQENLYKEKLIPQETYETTRANYNQAVLDFETARLNLERTKIRSPIDGQVVERMVSEGQFVNPSTQLMRMVNTRKIYGLIYLPERELIRVKEGQTVLIESDLFPGETFKGMVDQVSPVVDEQSGTFRVRYRVQEGIGKLRPGMFVRSHLIVAHHENAVVVPKEALIHEGDRTYVFVVREGKAYRVEVDVGIDGGDVVEIRSGVTPGMPVITAGYVGLRDGQPVRPMKRG